MRQGARRARATFIMPRIQHLFSDIVHEESPVSLAEIGANRNVALAAGVGPDELVEHLLAALEFVVEHRTGAHRPIRVDDHGPHPRLTAGNPVVFEVVIGAG